MAFQLSEEVVSRFRLSTMEKLDEMNAAWRRLLATPDDEVAKRLKRDLHTLKGDAHIFGFGEVSQLCHKLEELVEASSQHVFRVSDEVDHVVVASMRLIGGLVRRRADHAMGGFARFVRQIDEVLAEMPALAPRTTTMRTRPATMAPRLDPGERDRLSAETRGRLAVIATDLFVETLATGNATSSRLDEAWRALVGEIGRLRAVRLDLRLERHAQAARLLADDLGKPIEVSFEVPAEAVSARLVDALDEAVLHAVRNAVDHGIEAPEWREALGKPAHASLAIRARVTETVVEVDVVDDGAGVDLAAVRRRAVERNIVSEARAAGLSDAEATELLFAPGFSTRDRAGELSGRGIGLDALRAAVEAEEGTVTLTTTSGHGSTISVRVPHERPFVEVLRLPVAGAAFLAVAAEWRVAEAGADDAEATPEIDPWTRYGLDALRLGDGPALVVSSGRHRMRLCGAGAPAPATAQRLCPTAPSHPVEIVRIDGREGLLVRPDALLAAQQRAHPMR
jgi:two-component system chemotaxis sensor kinase CheA